MTTWICSGSRLKSQRASITSSPLFIIVAESTEILRPISQLGFRNPLRSSGQFVLVRGRGVLWLTKKPFVSTLVVTPERLETLDAQGQRVSQLDAREEPALRSINQLLLATLAADLAPLRALFSIDATLIGAAGWRLLLQPSDAQLARQLTRITLSGERHVHEVLLEERSGDRTEIMFAGLNSADVPSAAEHALLAGKK